MILLLDGWRFLPGKDTHGASRDLKTVPGSYGVVRQVVPPHNWGVVLTGCLRSVPGPRQIDGALSLNEAAQALDDHVKRHVRNLAREIG